MLQDEIHLSKRNHRLGLLKRACYPFWDNIFRRPKSRNKHSFDIGQFHDCRVGDSYCESVCRRSLAPESDDPVCLIRFQKMLKAKLELSVVHDQVPRLP